MGLRDSPLCRKCGAEDETSAHILCRCDALASISHAHLGSFFWEPEQLLSSYSSGVVSSAKHKLSFGMLLSIQGALVAQLA
jgi:predicted amidophosphoribosyltransferase